MQENDTSPSTRTVMTGVLIILIAFLVLSICFPNIIDTSTVHPPRVDIYRQGDSVVVVWLGGIDNGFVGNFTISINNESMGVFDKPAVNARIAAFIEPEEASVSVMAWDKAIQVYRPIGNRTV